MLHHPDFDPVAVHLGPLKVHWYGLMYLCAFAAAWWLASRRARRADSPVKPDQLEDLIFNGALGVVLGGRLGYVRSTAPATRAMTLCGSCGSGRAGCPSTVA